MRFVSLVAAGLALLVSSAAQAQLFQEWPSRDDRFVVNFPGEPTRTEMPYKTEKGTTLTAHVYTADAPANSIQAGTYSVTVVDYSSASPEEQTSAIEEAAAVFRTRGTVKYDGSNNIDQMASWRLTIETAEKRRILTEILMSNEKRLYIVEADTPVTVPPPAQFQASVQILDADGVRIRYRRVGSTERVR
jgi:hypothetical protein